MRKNGYLNKKNVYTNGSQENDAHNTQTTAHSTTDHYTQHHKPLHTAHTDHYIHETQTTAHSTTDHCTQYHRPLHTAPQTTTYMRHTTTHTDHYIHETQTTTDSTPQSTHNTDNYTQHTRSTPSAYVALRQRYIHIYKVIRLYEQTPHVTFPYKIWHNGYWPPIPMGFIENIILHSISCTDWTINIDLWGHYLYESLHPYMLYS